MIVVVKQKKKRNKSYKDKYCIISFTNGILKKSEFIEKR